MPDVVAPAATADHLLLFNRDEFHALNLGPGDADRVVAAVRGLLRADA